MLAPLFTLPGTKGRLTLLANDAVIVGCAALKIKA